MTYDFDRLEEIPKSFPMVRTRDGYCSHALGKDGLLLCHNKNKKKSGPLFKTDEKVNCVRYRSTYYMMLHPADQRHKKSASATALPPPKPEPQSLRDLEGAPRREEPPLPRPRDSDLETVAKAIMLVSKRVTGNIGALVEAMVNGVGEPMPERIAILILAAININVPFT